MMDIAHRKPLALITGAGRGIGRATALRLARQGMDLVLTGRDAKRLEDVAQEVRAAGSHGGAHADVHVRVLAGDLQDEAFWHALTDQAPHIDVLVHNASQPAPYGLVEDVRFDDIRAVIDSVLTSGLRLTQHVLPHMKAAGHGRIVFVGSMAWHMGAHGQVAYASAKAGLQGLVRSMALESARHGITCNLVEPGFIDTERTREAVRESVRSALAARTPVGRAGFPDEVAAVIAFLASPDASYVTGACIPVSGGIELGLPLSRQT
ncbi:MAG: SDR family NAD(P)-dependent oxidoreductase [Aquabacterium sp.]